MYLCSFLQHVCINLRSLVATYGFRSLVPALVIIQEETVSTSKSNSFERSARRAVESTPRELLTSLATVSNGVPAVKFAQNSPLRFTASIIPGGTSGKA